ncbi:MAG TPA: hypothetical protein P5079_08235 [Elusimicrobiota bacterium]|nr:hypothetical protein [Elusimicrobiota bacterium]
MDTILVVFSALSLLALGIITVYLVRTLDQVRRTARSLEILSDNLNGELSKVQKVTAAAAEAADLFTGGVGKSITLAAAFVRGFLKMKRKFSGTADEAGK